MLREARELLNDGLGSMFALRKTSSKKARNDWTGKQMEDTRPRTRKMRGMGATVGRRPTSLTIGTLYLKASKAGGRG